MKLDDLSPMPFGKFKGTPMQDVPVWYLHWLWTTSNFKNIKEEPVPTAQHQLNSYAIAMYIRDSLSALKQEDEDRIW